MSEQKRLLIVDDDTSNCRKLEVAFGQNGYNVATACSGQAALDVVTDGLFDVALLEIKLPDMEGTELLVHLKQVYPEMVVIMLTAHASMESAVGALNNGAWAYIVKPFEMDQVLATVWEGLERQRLVLENRQLHRQLQQELAMRLEADLERERLWHRLVKSDRMASLGVLAASVAHEINNPLAYLLFNLESLAARLPEVHAHLDHLRQGAAGELEGEALKRMLQEHADLQDAGLLDDLVFQARDALKGARLVRDVARELRLFFRKQEDRRVPVEVNKVLENAIRMVDNEVRHRARVVREYGDTPSVMVSESHLFQVLLNLLFNAAQSIEEGDVEGNEIRVSTWTDGKEVMAEVRDTGSGIPPEDLERVFEPFFTSKQSGKGSGLGLSIAQQITSAYGGWIEVQSEQGKGSRFVVHLPLKPTRELMEVVPAEDESTEAPQGERRGQVLVVDDEPDFGTAVQRTFGDEFDVVLATSDERARQVLAEESFDAILCDLLMPNSTGMDLFEWLRTQRPELLRRLIFVTGGAFTPRAQEFLLRVENPILEKPLDSRQLRSLLRRLVAANDESDCRTVPGSGTALSGPEETVTK